MTATETQLPITQHDDSKDTNKETLEGDESKNRVALNGGSFPSRVLFQFCMRSMGENGGWITNWIPSA